jgi:protein-disulfide isomerase
VRATRAYQVLPEWFAKATGYGLPYLEIAAGVLLVLGVATRLMAAALGVLLVGFLIGIIQASARGLQIECGCFGGGGKVAPGQTVSYTWDILRDSGLLLAAIYLVVWSVTKYAADDWIRAGGKTDPTTARVGPRRTKEAQRRLAALQEQRRKEGRRRLVAVSATAAVVLIAVGFIGIGVQSHRASTGSGSTTAAPAYANDDGILFGNPKAKVTVDLYEDFICPVCGEFEKADAKGIEQIAKDGTANFRYHSLGFLDANSSPAGYSTRAASAAAAMPNVTAWKKFHDLLYAHQPKEGTAGLSNKQLISYGKQAGAKDPALSKAINGSTYKSWVSKITDAASKGNVTGTPTVRIDGQDVQGSANAWPSLDELKKAIKAGHGNVGAGKSSAKGSNTWIVIVVILVVVLAVAFFVIPRNRNQPRRRT